MEVSETQYAVFEYSSISRVIFGVNSVEQLGDEASGLLDGRNCVVVTDRGVVRAGLVDRVEASLKKAGFSVEVCDKVEPEPALSSYQAVMRFVTERDPDILVGVGGGSSLDVAKGVARAATGSRPIEEYVREEFGTGGIPLITVPTTAGTGAEVTPDAVVRLPAEKVKSGFYNARATLAIVDPTMTLTLPPRLTAATGVDALSHAIESALSKTATPLTQALALESVRLISANLRTATFYGADLDARTKLSWATLIEGFSESNAGDVEGHAVAHVLGGFYPVHHGEACGIALPYCMKHNLPVNEPILARIGRAMDDSLSGTPRHMAENGIYAVHELVKEVALPTGISQIHGAKRDDLSELVKLYCTNPNITEILELFAKRGIPTQAEAAQFFEEMFEPEFSIPQRKSIA